jgi:hypothetical protein
MLDDVFGQVSGRLAAFFQSSGLDRQAAQQFDVHEAVPPSPA